MKTWVRKTLSVGVLAAGALLFAPAVAQADASQHSSDNNGLANGAQIIAPISIPVNAVGNAIGVAGEANAAGSGANWLGGSGQGAHQYSSDHNGALNGTQAYLPIDVPVNVVGNAVALLGEANAAGAGLNGRPHTESARTETGGGDGQHSNDHNGALNGTQLYAPVDAPINLCGNAISLLGEANAQAVCVSAHGGAESGGAAQHSNDHNGALNGTQAYAPVSIPLTVAGNAIGVAGEGNAAAATAGESGHAGTVGQHSTDTNGAGNGTQIAAPVQVPVNVCGNALSVLGEANASAACATGGATGDGAENPHQPGTGDDTEVDSGQGGTDDEGDAPGYGDRVRTRTATEATPLDGVTRNLTDAGGLNPGGLNAGGLDVLRTLR
ncbi:chaplin family protein [Jidongwangia harbinensis]|uniref:chaplin family protein n=1 Tax=Jidongwangia harbinensis TaxID=2878561 RepID=UPI001CDA0C5A|nr:chaplin family protein [Jidongwangia harbinensis]MCA2212772.1 DUF320 domain-containing protein [Jidongwangia harbinensis]